jgi:predicted small integral membrane protein
MPITRYAKIAMSLALAAFCLLVAFDNVADYNTNYVFVQHVLSMDTTFPDNVFRYRAVTAPALVHLAYGIVIVAEAVAGALFLIGAVRLFQARTAPATAFNAAKRYTIAGCLLAFLIWYFAIMVVAGEWFAMWESPTWNVEQPTFRFAMIALAVLIFVNQNDPDLPLAIPARRATPRRRRTDKTR